MGLFFWLFSGCFILKGSMPLILRYLGYYANPVRLTLESQYCAIILPKTFGNQRGSDILSQSDYDCAIGFDLCLVFLITFILRIAGSFILAYRYEAIPLYTNNNYINDIESSLSSSLSSKEQNDINNISVPLVKSRQSKENNVERKRNSRHGRHRSLDHIPTVGSINFDHNDYLNMDEIKEEEEQNKSK